MPYGRDIRNPLVTRKQKLFDASFCLLKPKKLLKNQLKQVNFVLKQLKMCVIWKIMLVTSVVGVSAHNPYAFVVMKEQIPPIMLSAATILTAKHLISVDWPLSAYNTEDLCVLTSKNPPAEVTKYSKEICLGVSSIARVNDPVTAITIIRLTRPITFNYGISVANLLWSSRDEFIAPYLGSGYTKGCRLLLVGNRLRFGAIDIPVKILSIKMVIHGNKFVQSQHSAYYDFFGAADDWDEQDDDVKEFYPKDKKRFFHSWNYNGSPLFCRDALVGLLAGPPYGCNFDEKGEFVHQFDCQNMKSPIVFEGEKVLQDYNSHALGFHSTLIKGVYTDIARKVFF